MTRPGDRDTLNLVRLLSLTTTSEPPRPHVCGNCRNPWTKYGRPDCPNAPQGG